MSEAGPFPPTAETVLTLLEYEGPLTRQELLTQTDRCASAVDDALNHLENRGRIHRARKSDNLRQTIVIFQGNTDV